MDIKTLVLALALGNLSLCAALFFYEYESRKRLSMSTWAVAKQVQAVAWLLLYLRGMTPELFTIALGNVVLFAGVALDAAALWELVGRRVWKRWLLPILIPACVAFVGAWLLGAPPGVRIAIASLVVGLLFLVGTAALARNRREASPLRGFLIVAMAVLSVIVVLRGILSAAWPEGLGWISPELVQWAGVGALYLMMLTNAFGYLLLTREKLQGELERQQISDTLTDVPNRRGFYAALSPWMALARRPGQPTAIIVLNLDQFKRVNDDYGHPVGDIVLKAMVDVCKRQLRDSDLMGRLGGAEFAIQLPRTSLEDALMVAERIRNAIASMPVKAERAIINLTASLGVTTIRADDSMVSLFKRADLALQEAKQSGRNRVVQAQPDSVLEA